MVSLDDSTAWRQALLSANCLVRRLKVLAGTRLWPRSSVKSSVVSEELQLKLTWLTMSTAAVGTRSGVAVACIDEATVSGSPGCHVKPGQIFSAEAQSSGGFSDKARRCFLRQPTGSVTVPVFSSELRSQETAVGFSGCSVSPWRVMALQSVPRDPDRL